MAPTKSDCSVTISRQMGSLGCDIARILADQLNYRLVWRDLINQAAQRAGVPEVALAAIDELGLLGICPSPEACHAYTAAVEQIMQDLARQGNVVIVGRAGQRILAGWPNTLHVRLIAPEAVRVERIKARYGISSEAARARIRASDRFRTNYLKKFYKVRWDDPNLYDLVINTANISPVTAASIITRSLEARLQIAPEVQGVTHGCLIDHD